MTTDEQWQEARAWLERADRDLRVARLTLAADPELLDNTAFHLQQATEKILKGLLTAKAERFRKIHTLDGLATWVGKLFPDLAGLLVGLGPYSAWVIAGRYHDQPAEGAPITRENAEALLARCEALLARARSLVPGS